MQHSDPANKNKPDQCNARIMLAFASAKLHSKLVRRYAKALEERVFNEHIERIGRDSRLITFKNKLCTQEAHDCLIAIWKESEFVPQRVVLALQEKKHFLNTPLTKNALSSHLCRLAGISDPDNISAIRSDLTRICDAAEAFGLIEFSGKSGNKRPMRGTLLLHQIMMEVHIDNARQIRSLSRSGVEGKQKGAVS